MTTIMNKQVARNFMDLVSKYDGDSMKQLIIRERKQSVFEVDMTLVRRGKDTQQVYIVDTQGYRQPKNAIRITLPKNDDIKSDVSLIPSHDELLGLNKDQLIKLCVIHNKEFSNTWNNDKLVESLLPTSQVEATSDETKVKE